MTGNDGQTAATAPIAGLAAARKIQNLSVADAARQLKLSVSQVEALEAGEFEKLPGPVFVRGFLRNYSRLLGLDPEEILRAVAAELPSPSQRADLPRSEEIPFPPAKARRWPRYAWVTLIVAGGIIAYESYVGDPMFTALKPGRLTNVTRPVPATPKPVAVPAAVPVERVQSAVEPVPAAPVSAPAAVPTMVPEIEKVVVPLEPSELPATPSPALQAEGDKLSMSAEREVRLSFDKASWVEIRDRFGKVIFSQLNLPGTERSLHGKPPLSLVIGNAHAVRVTYDDNPIDLQQYTKVDVARLTLE